MADKDFDSIRNLDSSRSFLTKTGALLAAVGNLVQTVDGPSVLPESDKESIAMQRIVGYMSDNKGSLEDGLKIHGKNMRPEVVAQLKKLSLEEWATVARLRERLTGLQDVVADNNGVVIM